MIKCLTKGDGIVFFCIFAGNLCQQQELQKKEQAIAMLNDIKKHRICGNAEYVKHRICEAQNMWKRRKSYCYIDEHQDENGCMYMEIPQK